MIATRRCPAKTENHECWLIEHPGKATHIDYSSGWPQPFSVADETWRNKLVVPLDPLQDAPEDLKKRDPMHYGPDDDPYDEETEGDDIDRP